MAGTGPYDATKCAIIAMARSWATAMAPRGIRADILVPDPIETNFEAFSLTNHAEGWRISSSVTSPRGVRGTRRPDGSAGKRGVPGLSNRGLSYRRA
ncbi:SDR family oxidoreductase [Swaminathania salitolerans]|uniref:SDR family oxidoreductase n=1 Tax=Swaminathania salitolerans TaxID=182838 RepID=UPI00222E53CC|nr:SDR family oxidoreductase [Swaminathania salitolerans]